MSELLNIDMSNISFSVLFVWLFYYTIKNNEKRETEMINKNEKNIIDINERNEKRENQYQETINKLVDKIDIVEDAKEKIDEVYEIVKGGCKNV